MVGLKEKRKATRQEFSPVHWLSRLKMAMVRI